MDNDEFIDKEHEDNTNIHQDLAHAIADFFYLEEESIYSFVTHINPQNPLYQAFYKLTKFLEKRKIQDQHALGRSAVIKAEQTEYDRVINKMTCSFMPEIRAFFEKEEVTLPDYEIKNIDNLLYLINANYFDEIQERNPSARRVFLVEQLLYVISFHLKTEGKSTFDEKDAKQVLDMCIFIPEDIKIQIALEFKNSKIKFGPFSNYEIVRRDITGGEESYLQARNSANRNRIPEWNIDLEENYITLIEALEVCEDFQNLEIGSAEDLCWDLTFIQRVLKLIHTNHKHELIALDENYSSFDLAWDFLFGTMAYAVSNGIPEITVPVVIECIEAWEYLPFDLKLKVLDEILETEKLDYSLHPYRTKKPENKASYQKRITPFKVSNENCPK